METFANKQQTFDMIKFPMENINYINIITGKHPYLRKYWEKVC